MASSAAYGLPIDKLIAQASRDPKDWIEQQASGGNKKFQYQDDPDSPTNRFLDSLDSAADVPEMKDWRGRELAPRVAAVKQFFQDPVNRDAAIQLGIQDPDSPSDAGQVLAYFNGGGKKQAAAPAKAEQAVSMAQQWQNQNPAGSGGGGGSYSSGGGSGFTPGSTSYASLLAGDADQRNGIYDQIAATGKGMADSFRSIGRQYYENAGQITNEIGYATRNAVDQLSPDLNLQDYTYAFTTPVGKKGQTLAQLTRDMING